jgi:hypothetical protein
LKVIADGANAGHLAVKGDGRYLARINPTGADAAAYGLCRRAIEVLIFLLDNTRFRVVERNFNCRFRRNRAVGVVDDRFGRACA